MKIYFAYRTGYKENLRHIKEFESHSILDFFRENWEVLKNDNYPEILGTKVYGFPLSFYGENSDATKPNSLSELLTKIEIGIYSNEVIGNEESISVYTDDDEIELMWYIFTDEYKKSHLDKVAIWFEEKLPVNFGKKGKEITNKKIIALEERNKDIGSVYFVSSPIYDSGNLEDICVIKIEGIRTEGLIPFLRANRLKEHNSAYYAINELNYMGFIANELNTNELKTVLENFSKYPLCEIGCGKYLDLSLEMIAQEKLRNNPEKSKITINKHSAEISVNSIEEFYNYYFIMDDLWIETNETLANSMVHFGTELEF